MWSWECIGKSKSHKLTSAETLHISTMTDFKHQLTSLGITLSFIPETLSFGERILGLIPPLHLVRTKCVGNHLYNTLDLVFTLTLHHHSDTVFVTHKNNNQSSWHATSPSQIPFPTLDNARKEIWEDTRKVETWTTAECRDQDRTYKKSAIFSIIHKSCAIEWNLNRVKGQRVTT